MEFRAEQPEDIAAIRRVNETAFGRKSEADLVDRLRGVESTFSFVAIELEQVVGHIFFSPVMIEGECAYTSSVLGLAPIAVMPDYQGQGVGSLLIQQGLAACARLGFKAVVVLGSPKYYRRFGFMPAKEYNLSCEYLVPDDAFMALELQNNGLDGCIGKVKYRPEFYELV